MFADFKQAAEIAGRWPLEFDRLETLQVNLGNLCNQQCRHCHVKAGPDGKRIMPASVMQSIIEFVGDYPVTSVDLTGGCPELNPNFRFFIEGLYPLTGQIKIRTNLTIMCEPGMDWLAEFYKKYTLVLVGSLPCYTMKNVDSQRGTGVFKKSVKALQILNNIGYGTDWKLELNLVYNPGSAVLPGPEARLEADYKEHLFNEYGIVFNRLFTMTNAPIGRFRQYLESTGNLDKYSNLLKTCFNPQTLENIMCRNLLSVDYMGIVYNCDFNQILKMPLRDENLNPLEITKLKDSLKGRLEILAGEHCFSCTAGSGSSCTGILARAS